MSRDKKTTAGQDKLAKQLFNTEHGLYASEHPKTTAGQDILAKRLKRGDIVVDGLIRRKGK